MTSERRGGRSGGGRSLTFAGYQLFGAFGSFLGCPYGESLGTGQQIWAKEWAPRQSFLQRTSQRCNTGALESGQSAMSLRIKVDSTASSVTPVAERALCAVVLRLNPCSRQMSSGDILAQRGPTGLMVCRIELSSVGYCGRVGPPSAVVVFFPLISTQAFACLLGWDLLPRCLWIFGASLLGAWRWPFAAVGTVSTIGWLPRSGTGVRGTASGSSTARLAGALRARLGRRATSVKGPMDTGRHRWSSKSSGTESCTSVRSWRVA